MSFREIVEYIGVGVDALGVLVIIVALLAAAARFLAQGGQIKEIPPDVTTDPPQKPVSNYGSKPI